MRASGLAADYVYEDEVGNLWMLAWSPVVGLVKYDRQAKRLTNYPLGEGAVGIASSNFLADGRNGFWVSSSRGLCYFDRRAERWTYRFQHDETNPDSLNDNTVASVYRDRGGLLWVGTEDGGLNLLNLQQEQFGFYHHRANDPNSLSPGKVTAIYEEPGGILWIGFFPRRLDRLDRKTGQVTHYVPGPQHKNSLGEGADLITIYKDVHGYLWLGGWGSGLVRFDGRTGQFKHYVHKPDDPNSYPADNPYKIYGDRTGQIWVGQRYGLSRLDPATEQFTNYRPDPSNPNSQSNAVWAVYQDHTGTMWLGTRGGVLSRFDDKTKTFLNYTPDPRDPRRLYGGGITSIHEDRSGTLWVGGWDGLYRFNHHDGTFTRYTESQGLPSSVIQGILEDKAGRLWLGTKKGISRFDPKTETFRNYDESDGLQGDEFSESCFFQGPDGEMFFGGSHGFNAFFPEDIRDNPYVPPVVITSFKIINKRVPIGANSVLTKAVSYVDGLTLSYRDNVFSLGFAALSYANSYKNRYRYKLEGFDPGWNEAGSTQRLATYTNLDPGRYVFRVQGSNSDGVWNEEGVSLPILITPPWWRTNWFRALCVVVFLALLWAAHRLRVGQLEAQEKKFREAVETMPALAFIARPDGYRTFVNRGWVEYTGMTVEQATGSGWEAAVHPDDLEKVMAAWKTSAATGGPLDYETRLRRGADGAYRWFHTRAVPLRDKRGKMVKWCGVANDIEDRKRAEQERDRLRQLEADLAHINRVSMMGELTASIAHEVNQPLSGVVSNGSACLRWLAGEAPNVEEAREAARRIVRDGRRAGDVIARVRALAKRAATPNEKLDLNEVIREVLALVADEAKRNSVVVGSQFATDAYSVLGDRVQLQQVMLNLVMNAIEAMSTVHDRPRELLIATRNLDADQVEVTVNDSGPGIDPNMIDKIFDPFFTTKPDGMGMGLSISRTILQAHRGRLWAAAKDSPGTIVHFSIPKYREDESNAAA